MLIPLISGAWVDLLLINYPIEPGLLHGRAPTGTCLDLRDGLAMMSLVGVRFTGLRILGFPVPFFQDFAQVNLRFYVRRSCPGGVRQGVTFIRQVVPSPLMASAAHIALNEDVAVRGVRWRVRPAGPTVPGMIAYDVTAAGHARCRAAARFIGRPEVPGDATEATFVTERHWGYSRQRDGSTIEYRVDHPRWLAWPAQECEVKGELEPVFGPVFGPVLARPGSAYVAAGSAIRFPSWVRRIRAGEHFNDDNGEVFTCREGTNRATPTSRSAKPSTLPRGTRSAGSTRTKPRAARGQR